MLQKHYTTANTNSRERLAFWREAVCDSYVHLGCEAPKDGTFHGEIALDPVKDVTVSRVSGSRQRVTRRKRDISRSTDAFFLLSVQLEGTCLVEQGTRMADLKVGDFALYSSTDPYLLLLPQDFRQLVLQVPRTALIERLPNADQLTGQRVIGSGKTAAAVRSSMMMLVDCIKQSDANVRACLEESLVDLVATGLATLDTNHVRLNAPEETTRARAQSYILDNLSDPDLDRNRVAAATGLSVRRLNELFQKDDQSISNVIRAARLQRIASDLRDYRYAADTVSIIALRRGVRNLEHFSQVFRKQFGVTPRDYRRQQ